MNFFSSSIICIRSEVLGATPFGDVESGRDAVGAAAVIVDGGYNDVLPEC